MTATKKLISIVVPAFNEEDCIDELARRLTAVMDGLTNYQFEALIVDKKLLLLTRGSSQFDYLEILGWMVGSPLGLSSQPAMLA